MSITATYNTVSNRESLSDDLSMLAPEETPFLSGLNKSKAKATYEEWTTDKLSDPTDEGIAEGEDVQSYTNKHSGRARLGNYIQKWRRDWQVSDFQEAVESVGPAGIARSESKCVREIKRDMEKTLLGNNDRSADDGAGTKYKLRGLGNWIDSAGPSDVPADYRTPASSIHSSGAFTETVLNDLITSIYRENGEYNSLTLLADTALRRKISDFERLGDSSTTIRNVNYTGGSGELAVTVDLYKSDQGIVSIMNMNPVCAPDTTNKDTGYLINWDYLSLKELIPLKSTRHDNEGGGERGIVECTSTLCVKHPGALGKITTLS